MSVFVTTTEGSGIDRYSQEIGKRIGVPTVASRRYLSPKAGLGLLHRLRDASGVVHFPSQHFARFGLFLARPFVITVHDLARICFPFGVESLREKVGLKLDALGLRRADHIIAVSARTKVDLVQHLQIPEDKISVIYNGTDRQVFRPVNGRRFGFPYLLYVGTERPRKNLATLLRALSILKREAGVFQNLKLVKVGAAGRTDEFRRTTLREVERLGLTDEVIFTDSVSDEALARYYSSAEALIVPSLYEGFGLPLVEAMACGCPVITSDGSALPEVAGDAALFFDPCNASALADCIRRLFAEPALTDELIRRGFERVERFSWERAADATLRVYHDLEASPDVSPDFSSEREAKAVSCSETVLRPRL